MYKALKKFQIGDKTFNPGDEIPKELMEDRFLRSKKAEYISGNAEEIVEEVEIKEELLIETPSEVEVVVEETPKQTKKSKKKK